MFGDGCLAAGDREAKAGGIVEPPPMPPEMVLESAMKFQLLVLSSHNEPSQENQVNQDPARGGSVCPHIPILDILCLQIIHVAPQGSNR